MSSQFRGQVVSEYFAQLRRRAPLFALVWLLGSSAIPAKAQSYLQNIGVPPFTTQLPVENGFINAANGNLHLEIPLGSFPQRGGAPDKIVLMYDSAIWNPIVDNNFRFWEPNNVATTSGSPTGGWRLVTSRETGFPSYSELDTGYCPAADDYYWANYGWSWVGPDGTVHAFLASTKAPLYPNLGCNATGTPSASGYATDGSGFFVSVTNYTNVTVYAPDGTIINTSSSTNAVEDSNGNYAPPVIFNGGSINYVDTLGRTVLTQTASGNTKYYAVPNTQGGTSTYTATWQQISVQSNFGQSGYTEYSGTIWVIQSIQLPDGTSYSFQYDTGSGVHYGLLTSMTLPTGAQISYSYTNFFDGMGFVSRWINGRTTPDGTWTYGQSVLSTCPPGYTGCQQQFTVTKPSGDNTVYTLTVNYGDWPAQVQYYTGSISSANLVATVSQCFSFVTVTNGSCSYSTGTGLPWQYIQLLARTTTLPIPGGSNLSTTTEYSWDSSNQGIYGEMTQISEWNFGSSPGNTPDRTTSIGYLNGSAYINANILNRPTSVTTTDKNGNLVAETQYAYDFYALGNASGVANHDDTNYGTGNTVRGNVELVQRVTTPSTFLGTWIGHDTTGQIASVEDSNLHSTYYYYNDNFFTDGGNNSAPSPFTPSSPTHAYLTSVAPPIIPATNFGYYFGTGQLASMTDPNGKSTYSHFYDLLNRPTATLFPDGGWNLTQYPGASENQNDTYTGITTTTPTASCPSSSSGGCGHNQEAFDTLGRVTNQVLVNDPDGQTTVATTYDANGRVQTASNPYRSTNDPTYGVETSSYDGLDRVTQLARTDGNAVTTSYGAQVGASASQLCYSSVYGFGYPILTVDEAGKKRQRWIDGFGRTIETDEPDANGNLSYGTCYSYDLNNNVVGVVSAGGTQQICTAFNYVTYTNVSGYSRCYSYDMLSRLISKTEPESGTTNFSYGSFTWSTNALCSADPSAICARTDARSITINYQYDALNRLTSKTYSDGTPNYCYYYDAASNWGHAVTNTKGRMSGQGTCSSGQYWNAQIFSYDPMGRVLRNDKCSPANCASIASGGYWTLNYGYDLLGDMTSATNGMGTTISYSYDSAGRPSTATSSLVDSQHPANLATIDPSQGYWPDGSMRVMTLGNGLTGTAAYNKRLQPCLTEVNSSGTYFGTCYDSLPNGNIQDFSYSFPSANNGNLVSWSGIGARAFNRSFTYDALNRISTLSSPSDPSGCTGYAWYYDALGNRTSQTPTGGTNCYSSSLAFNVYNQVTSFQYDAAGNLTNDGVHTYFYDAENRLLTVDGGNTASYIYDPNGQRLAKVAGGFPTTYFRDPAGNVLTELNSGVWANSYAYFGGQLLAQYSTATTYFAHPDHLGSTRLLTAMDHSVYSSFDYLPFGEKIVGTGTTHEFTGYERDSETDPGNGTGNDYAFARYHQSRNGRLMSIDPMGGDITDPQTLNRYAYVLNNPVNMTDPSGLCAGSDLSGDGGDGGDCGGIGIGFGIGWGAGSDSGRTGPQSPVYFPPNVGTSPNGTLTSDDPFSGETNGIPNGLQIPTIGLPGLLMPGDPGCQFGACGVTQGFDNTDAVTLGGLCAAQPETCALFTIYVTAWGAYEVYQALRPIIESHRTNIRPSTEQKHEEGEARKNQDRGGEKGDERRRPPRKRPYGWKTPWPPAPGVKWW